MKFLGPSELYFPAVMWPARQESQGVEEDEEEIGEDDIDIDVDAI